MVRVCEHPFIFGLDGKGVVDVPVDDVAALRVYPGSEGGLGVCERRGAQFLDLGGRGAGDAEFGEAAQEGE